MAFCEFLYGLNAKFHLNAGSKIVLNAKIGSEIVARLRYEQQNICINWFYKHSTTKLLKYYTDLEI